MFLKQNPMGGKHQTIKEHPNYRFYVRKCTTTPNKSSPQTKPCRVFNHGLSHYHGEADDRGQKAHRECLRYEVSGAAIETRPCRTSWRFAARCTKVNKSFHEKAQYRHPTQVIKILHKLCLIKLIFGIREVYIHEIMFL